eukprot:5080883-Prymnesium_polylepis.2
MLGGHAAVLRRAAGSTLVAERTLLRARQKACTCMDRPTDALRAEKACAPGMWAAAACRLCLECVYSGLSGTACKHAESR